MDVVRAWIVIAMCVACRAPERAESAASAGRGATAVVETPPLGIDVGVSPLIASVAPGETVQLTARVTGGAGEAKAVRWSATGGAITRTGLYTAPAEPGGYAIRATSTEDARADAIALVNVTGPGAVHEPFYESQKPYVQLMTPMPHATYIAPATIRMWAHAPDTSRKNVNNYAPEVEFYLDDTMVKRVAIGLDDLIDYYEATISEVRAGEHVLSVRSKVGTATVESVRVPIHVVELASTGPVVNLTKDLVLAGDTDFELIGTPAARARLVSSNGSRIKSEPGWTGRFVIRHADVVGLGKHNIPALEVAARGTSGIEIANTVFDRTGPVWLGAYDDAGLVFRDNELRPNLLLTVNSEANYAASRPSMLVIGNSRARKRFQGNNIGVSFVRFDRTSHWLIGGDRDSEGNVLLGVRAGIEIHGGRDITIRGNISSHRYPFGWSQGLNLAFERECSGVLIEHNVFRNGSWMIQNLPGEFRYNLLVDNINEAFLRYSSKDSRFHHNILVNTAFQRPYVPSGGVVFANGAFYANTVDVGGAKLGWFDYPFIASDAKHKLASVRNNVFTGFAYRRQTEVVATGATESADHNCFYNPDTTALVPYGDTGFGVNDCGSGASTDPRFAHPRALPFPISDGDLWRRRITVSQILALYRGMYTPAPGSPLIDAGDPRDDTGGARNTDIGAVGAGAPHPDDRFGRFGGGTAGQAPAAPEAP